MTDVIRDLADSNKLSPQVRQFQRAWHFETFDKAWRLYEIKRFREAITLASEALRIDPDVAKSWVGYGVILMEAGQLQRAVSSFKRALKLKPNYARAWSRLGEALSRLNRSESATFCHERALKLRPDVAVFHYRKAKALIAEGRYAEAIPILDQASQLDARFVDPLWERGECRRRLEDYALGWTDYELRFGLPESVSNSSVSGVRWNGEAFPCATLLVLDEQGFGDSIWAARYCRCAKARGGRVVLQTRRELVSLFSNLAGVDEIVEKGSITPHYDLYIPICSLPGIFTPSVGAIPQESYLTPDDARMSKFAPWLGLANGRLKVGLIWSGSVHFRGNSTRALPLQTMLDVFDLPGVQLYALQKGQPSAQVAYSSREPGCANLIDLGPLLEDFADTATLVAALDLVIMTDSSTAHLAGALGRPVWMLLNHVSYWLWGKDAQTTPWYPSMRLFRAPRANAWDVPLDHAAAALMQLTSKGTQRASASILGSTE